MYVPLLEPAADRRYKARMVAIVEEHVGYFNRRFVVELEDGARVESVLYRGDTLCVSSQVGCAVACPFCASGAHGFGRNLSFEELRGQLTEVEARGHPVVRATVSGVGEPLHNLASVEALLDYCRQRRMRLSLTTSGGPLPRLLRALQLPHNGLTISVHAGSEAMRARLVPHAPALRALFDGLASALPLLSARRRRKLALAYLVVDEDNATDAEVDAFVERVRPLGVTVHLYDLNPVPGSAHHGAGEARYRSIYARMTAAGLRVRMSSKARLEANGGCGTLVALRPARRATAPVGA